MWCTNPAHLKRPKQTTSTRSLYKKVGLLTAVVLLEAAITLTVPSAGSGPHHPMASVTTRNNYIYTDQFRRLPFLDR